MLTTLQLAIAREAGAQFIVTPNTDRPIIHAIKALGLLAFPGAMTPTEAQRAHAAGADAVKIFPAGTLGPAYLKAIASPLSHIPFLAVGGVNDTNIAEFLRAGAIGAGVGGNLVNREWIEREEWGMCKPRADDFSAFCPACRFGAPGFCTPLCENFLRFFSCAR